MPVAFSGAERGRCFSLFKREPAPAAIRRERLDRAICLAVVFLLDQRKAGHRHGKEKLMIRCRFWVVAVEVKVEDAPAGRGGDDIWMMRFTFAPSCRSGVSSGAAPSRDAPQ